MSEIDFGGFNFYRNHADTTQELRKKGFYKTFGYSFPMFNPLSMEMLHSSSAGQEVDVLFWYGINTPENRKNRGVRFKIVKNLSGDNPQDLNLIVTVQNYIGVPEICEVINTYHMDPEEGEIYFPNIEGEVFPPILAKTFEDPTELQFRLTYGGDSNYSNTEWLTLTIPDSPADPTIDHDND